MCTRFVHFSALAVSGFCFSPQLHANLNEALYDLQVASVTFDFVVALAVGSYLIILFIVLFISTKVNPQPFANFVF